MVEAKTVSQRCIEVGSLLGNADAFLLRIGHHILQHIEAVANENDDDPDIVRQGQQKLTEIIGIEGSVGMAAEVFRLDQPRHQFLGYRVSIGRYIIFGDKSGADGLKMTLAMTTGFPRLTSRSRMSAVLTARSIQSTACSSLPTLAVILTENVAQFLYLIRREFIIGQLQYLTELGHQFFLFLHSP